MLLKFRQSLGGHSKDGTTFHIFPNEEVEWEDEEDARRLIAAKIATPVKSSDAETAALSRKPVK